MSLRGKNKRENCRNRRNQEKTLFTSAGYTVPTGPESVGTVSEPKAKSRNRRFLPVPTPPVSCSRSRNHLTPSMHAAYRSGSYGSYGSNCFSYEGERTGV